MSKGSNKNSGDLQRKAENTNKQEYDETICESMKFIKIYSHISMKHQYSKQKRYLV